MQDILKVLNNFKKKQRFVSPKKLKKEMKIIHIILNQIKKKL